MDFEDNESFILDRFINHLQVAIYTDEFARTSRMGIARADGIANTYREELSVKLNGVLKEVIHDAIDVSRHYVPPS